MSELKGSWKPTPEEFNLVGKATVRVEHEGKPVAVAFVKIKDDSGERESQVDASKNGEATFFGDSESGGELVCAREARPEMIGGVAVIDAFVSQSQVLIVEHVVLKSDFGRESGAHV